MEFQSTCPARGTTRDKRDAKAGTYNFNPRAPRGARHVLRAAGQAAINISIHVPREGHDFENRRFGTGTG